MKKFLLCLVCFLLVSSSFAFDKGAIWQPPKEAMNKIFKCYDQRENNIDCVAGVMQAYGASKQAIKFATLLNGHGFMDKFQEIGVVDFARTLAFAADHSQGFYLINGKPQIINVDDSKYLDKDLWPGDDHEPQIKLLENGGRQFIFTYPIKTCHACTVTGHGQIEFNFANDGTFLGSQRVK